MQVPGYQIIRKIDQGGMSTVYLAIQLSVGREVALKVMSPALNADPVFSERFQREANIVGQLSHPNIISIYDIGCHKSLNYIAMDYLSGGSVHNRMSTGMSTKEVLRVIKEVAQALDHAHGKHYIHRDIKPENILFREDGTAVLSDFGVAKMVSKASQVTNAGTVVGTPYYMSPEQARGQPIDGRSDIYSLGVVFYEMLTGSVPFKADEAVAIAIKHLTAPIPKLPAQHAVFQKLLNRLLAKDEDKRFQRGNEVVEAIEEIERNLLGGTPPYMTNTDPTGVQITSLLKALVITSYAVLLTKLRQGLSYLRSFRWTPKRGLYRRPSVAVTEIRTEADTGEDEKSTVISSRIQRAAYYQSGVPGRARLLSKTLALGFVVSILWGTFSVALSRFELPGEQRLPASVQRAALGTAVFIADSLQAVEPDRGDSATAAAGEGAAAANALAPLPTEPPSAPAPAAGAGSTAGSAADTKPPPPAAAPPRAAFTVDAEPARARIRVLNIREKYRPGMLLKPGSYHIEVTHAGYKPVKKWVRMRKKPLTVSISLRRQHIPGTSFFNQWGSGEKGPEMQVLPAGDFTMGNARQADAAPPHRVTFSEPFAISKFEVTFADYKKFALDTGTPLPEDKQWGQGSRPVINVSWHQARAYAAWLSEKTGRTYRLPSEAEWEYAARSGTSTAFWWGDASAEGRANCRRGCRSQFTGLFSARTAPVGSYQPNQFGVYDTAGNVAEWVADCYQNHYLNAPGNGAAVDRDGCESRVIRGGSIKDNSRRLHAYLRTASAAQTRAEDVGFRVVVELP